MAKLALDEMAVERVSAIYESFVEDLTLTGAARRDMKKRRGFTDETIDALKFRSIGNKKLVEAAMKATGATEDELLAVKLLVDGKHGPYPNPQLTKMPERARDAVLLPYISNHGQISKLRVHRNNFWKDGIRPYCGRVGKTYEGDDVDLILCEGEFKAAALYQEGYAALAVPGISSFAGDHFDQLVEAIGHIRHKRLIVCFDREIKNDPTLAGFKSNYRKRWDTEFYTWLMAHRLDGYVAMLPKDWMVEGKVDFDQALAAGRGRADFDAIFAKAVTPLRFLDQLEDEAAAVVRRKSRAFLRGEGNLHFTEQRNAALGYGYLWHEFDERKQETKTTRVSDFVLDLIHVVKTDREDAETERIVTMTDTFGETSRELVLRPGDLCSLQAFKQWVLGNGECTWFGGTKALDGLCQHLNEQSDGARIRRTSITGEVEDGLFLFQNGVITAGHYVAPSPDDGIAWFGRRGYVLEPDMAQPRILSSKPESLRELDEGHAELLELLRENMSGDLTAWLGIGWGLATAFSRILFNRFKFFPILYCMGQKGSGKTTFARWLMNGLFGIETLGRPMLSTEKSQYRLLAKRASMPAWFDEFRETRDLQRQITSFCSIYNRQGYMRAARSNDTKTNEVPVRGTLLLGGVVPPKDDQLQSRCVYLQFAESRRDNRTAKEGGTYDKITERLPELNDLLVSSLLRYDELAPQIIRGTLAAADMFKNETGDVRMATNYAMAVSAFHSVCGDLVDTSELVAFSRTAMGFTGARLAAEHPLSDFWEAVSAMAAKGYLAKLHIDRDESRVYIWLQGVFHAFESDYRRRRGMDVPFRERDVRDWLSQQDYWAPPTANGNGKPRTNRRMGGQVKRVIALRRELCPAPLLEAVDAVYEETTESGTPERLPFENDRYPT